MASLGKSGRVLLGVAGLILFYVALIEVVGVWQTDLGADYGPLKTFFARSIVVSIPALPLGLVLTALRPWLWPVPVAALVWAVGATVLVDPQRFDFAIEWLLQFSS